jgi:membrane protein implicated in regulation of membrane protease activity
MGSENGFLTGFLILGFAIFIAGFLTGMLALAVLGVSSDLTTLELMAFALGFVAGILTFGLTYTFMKWRKKQRQTLSEPELKTN